MSAQPPPLPDREPAPPPLPDDAALPGDELMSDPGPLPDPGPLGDPAVLHLTEQTRTYPCRACGGLLVFNPDAQAMRCPSCGSEQPVVEVGGEVLRHDLRTAMRALTEQRQQADRRLVTTESRKEIVCQSCGGHTAFTGSLTAIRCPYCNTPIQRDDLQDAPLRLPVDGVLPLRLGEDNARVAIEKWINSRWFAPNEFKKYRTLGSFTSIYLTYFCYDSDSMTHYRGMRGDNYTVTVGSGDNRRTEVRTRWWPTSGTIQTRLREIPAVANSGFDARRITDLEPWPTREAKPYSPEYVSGHLSRTYDADAGQVYEADVKHRIQAEIEQGVRRDIGGDKQRITGLRTTVSMLEFSHLLCPVWLLTVSYRQEPYQVFINGMTGEVQGDRPYSAIKITLAVLAAVVVIVVAIVLYQLYGG